MTTAADVISHQDRIASVLARTALRLDWGVYRTQAEREYAQRRADALLAEFARSHLGYMRAEATAVRLGHTVAVTIIGARSDYTPHHVSTRVYTTWADEDRGTFGTYGLNSHA